MKVFTVINIILLFVCSGCGHQVLDLEKVSGSKNTFVLKNCLGVVAGVAIYEITEVSDNDEPNIFYCYNEPSNKPHRVLRLCRVWSIKKGSCCFGMDMSFRLTAPEMPDGFIQLLPKPPEHFQLCKGQPYEILVYYSSGVVPAHFRWIAE
jgi:hypothetical protein